MLFIISSLEFTTAPPNPILDNESDSDLPVRTYEYPDFETATSPYWQAYPKETKIKMKKHDQMEINLIKIRKLDFKLRESWTVTDTPFTLSV